MSITTVREAHWPAILRLQDEAYSEIEPEPLQVLQSKWHQSPDLCFVYEDMQSQDIGAYLLAHAWHSPVPPKLYSPLPPASEGDCLFVHDLAVSPRYAGQGIGQKMMAQLMQRARAADFDHIRLVSVQDSSPFWAKMGFKSASQASVDDSYGPGAVLMTCALATQSVAA
ncbi:hypothetical protein BFW38_11545 [Terasakiispira papahanaumokuakeensis]|uniref:N-acetyltransferase domain-containing protein n=1 Tax=Terasakiispira papahanaumokuakeensis TaxID=197479 RepID=A0A1E2VAX7_9GAMM|nr:GNAT family N-acetyltransferase [Terasakiispira papahanaumokuakeensis]ODC04073.1 hypothetical protein BFW38_11545 [Terasakiispira papahanaumokuakeensis]